MFLTRGPDSDFHVLTQSREEFHQSANGKVTGAIPHQQGDLRLHALSSRNGDLRPEIILSGGVNAAASLLADAESRR